MSCRLCRFLAAAAVGPVLAAGAPAGVASAHAALTSASPKDGAVVHEMPQQLRLTFNERLQDDFTIVRVVSDGQRVSLRKARTAGAVVTQPMPADLPAGRYTAAYRVVSADGHPIAGQLSFRLTPTSPEQGAGSAAAPRLSSPTVSQPSASLSSPSDTAAASTDDSGASWPWMTGAALVLALAVGGVLIAGRRRGRVGT